MVKLASVCAISLGMLLPFSPAAADDSLAKFKGGIGVIPVSSGVVPVGEQPLTAEAVNRNFVRGVPPAGQIWVIADLKADVKTDGSIKVSGKGLLLGGGDNIGTNANQSVRATLICRVVIANKVTFELHNTNLVPLEPNGDFNIDDVLIPAAPVCDIPVLLIRNPAGAWFAAGIPDL